MQNDQILGGIGGAFVGGPAGSAAGSAAGKLLASQIAQGNARRNRLKTSLFLNCRVILISVSLRHKEPRCRVLRWSSSRLAEPKRVFTTRVASWGEALHSIALILPISRSDLVTTS